MNIEDLRTFVEVADAGGVSPAARRLGISKSVVSRRLEAELGIQLRARTTRGAGLTEAGVTFREYAAKTCADIDIARAATRSDWTIEIMYSQRGPDYSDMMSVNVSKPIQWRESRRQGRELAARLATAERARARREEETRAHLAEAMALLQSWQANRERLQRYTVTLLPLAAERTVAATTAYRSRTGSLDAALEARVGEVEAQVAHLDLALETAAMWAELNYLVPGSHEAGDLR